MKHWPWLLPFCLTANVVAARPADESPRPPRMAERCALILEKEGVILMRQKYPMNQFPDVLRDHVRLHACKQMKVYFNGEVVVGDLIKAMDSIKGAGVEDTQLIKIN